MLKIEVDCNNYKDFKLIGAGNFGDIYKAKNKKTGNLVAIKNVNKLKHQKSLSSLLRETEIMNKIKSENTVCIKETIDTKDNIYIIMDLCECNLEEYVKRRENPISIKEIKEVLLQLNNVFKIFKNENIIHRDLKPSNILISIDKLDKCLIKLSDYGSSKIIDLVNTKTLVGTPLTMAPEVLKEGNSSFKSDIWSLGVVIYFMLNKSYPYQGNNEYLLFQDINSGKKLNLSKDSVLNDLIVKMLKINPNERISWDEYFNHPFFKTEYNDEINQFNFACSIHSKIINYYCEKCKKNICDNCVKEHSSHKIISFNKIGLNDNEIKKIDLLYEEINNNLNSLNKKKENIQNLLLKLKEIKENKLIYEKDMKNNFKEYIISQLETINQKLKFNDLRFIDLVTLKNQNEIICTYDIKNNNLKEGIRIINSYEEVKKAHENWGFEGASSNEKEIKNNCEIYINDKKIDFCYKYNFPKEGKYTIKFKFKELLTNANYMFCECEQLFSVDLSNLNTNNVTNMSSMFLKCSSLNSLTLSDFNNNMVTNMTSMFSNCSSLTSLNLSNLDTIHVNNMSYMFFNCSSLKSLNLSNFNTINVTDMSYMFSECSSLTSLNLLCFNTNKVTNMNNMFSKCSSLNSLDLTTFKINNNTDINSMFLGIKNDCNIKSNEPKLRNED